MFKQSAYARTAGTAGRSRTRQWMCCTLGLLLASAAGHAQEFPARPIRVIVASGAGGGTDLTARHVIKTLSEQLRYSAFVENRPGAGSTTGTDFVAKVAPDGYTLLFSSGSTLQTKTGAVSLRRVVWSAQERTP